MRYKLYVNRSKGFENLGEYTGIHLIALTDNIIKSNEFESFIIVECNKREDMEFPILVCSGYNIEEYMIFRENFLEKFNFKSYIKV